MKNILSLLIILISLSCYAQNVDNIIVRVVYVTPDWMPYTMGDAFLSAAPLKETQSLKYYDVAIWEENKSIQLYAISNNYFDDRPIEGSSEIESYRESFTIAKVDGLPEINQSIERSTFLKNAMQSFVSTITELHPSATHHLSFSGHGGPGGSLFQGLLLPKHVTDFLSFWNQELGHKLGVIDMGGPCVKGDFSALETYSDYADYYIASDLPNGGYTMDEWTFEKYQETDPEYQYHRIFKNYPILLDALKERINLKRKAYEYSRENMIANKVKQANYLYSCENFTTFSTAFKSYMLKKNIDFYYDPNTSNYNSYLDLYSFLLNENNDSLLSLFDKIILHKADNQDFFEWQEPHNGLIIPMRSSDLSLNMVPPYVELPADTIAQKNEQFSIEVKAYDIELDELVYSWRQLSGTSVSITNDTSPKISFITPDFRENETLKLEVTVSDGKYTISDTILVSHSIQSEVFELNNKTVNIYPIPAFNNIKIDTDNNHNYSVKLINLKGTVLREGINKTNLNVSDIAEGIYFLEIKDLYSTKKIVKKIIIR